MNFGRIGRSPRGSEGSEGSEGNRAHRGLQWNQGGGGTPPGPRGTLEQARPDSIELLGELSCPRVVRAAVQFDGPVALGQLEVGGTLQVDVTPVCVGQQPPAHEHHRAILKGRDARPLEGRLLEESVANLSTGR
eukprot:1644482-Prymnesium_polylepis.1